MPESRKIFEEEVLLEPAMASVAYRGKVEERYQAKSLIEALKLCRADGRTHFLLHDPLGHRRHRDL